MKNSLNNKKNKSMLKGFSILELALSIAIIALIVIFIIGMYSMFFTANTKLNDVTVANFIGQSWLNKIASYSASESDSAWITTKLNPTATPIKKNVSYGLYSAQFVGGKSFTVYIWTNPIYSNPNADLYAVNVTVYWMEAKNKEKNKLIKGYGKNYLDFKKIVSIPKNF